MFIIDCSLTQCSFVTYLPVPRLATTRLPYKQMEETITMVNSGLPGCLKPTHCCHDKPKVIPKRTPEVCDCFSEQSTRIVLNCPLRVTEQNGSLQPERQQQFSQTGLVAEQLVGSLVTFLLLTPKQLLPCCQRLEVLIQAAKPRA